MILTRKLTKTFSGRVVVDAIDLQISEGEVFGVLGPNGAGKTTTVRMLSCLVAPSSGEAYIHDYKVGSNNDQIRHIVGVLTESPGLYERLSAKRNLEFFGALYDIPKQRVKIQVEKYLTLLGLWHRRDDAVATFSKGMKQKVAIARTLLHEPRVVFLDEPTSGLDPESTKMVRDFIAELKNEGRTIILCTHNLDEAERLCDRVGVLRQSLIRVDTPSNMRKSLFGRRTVVRLNAPPNGILAAVKRLDFAREAQQLGQEIVVPLAYPEEHNPTLIKTIVEAGGGIVSVTEQSASLEDVYLNLITTQHDKTTRQGEKRRDQAAAKADGCEKGGKR